MVKLKVGKKLWPYIETKPVHGSQKVVEHMEDGSVTIALEVHLNYELESLILGFGEGVEVLESAVLKKKISARVHEMTKKYGMV
jgi:predicted DNA-binding transcriptional regulator YafY